MVDIRDFLAYGDATPFHGERMDYVMTTPKASQPSTGGKQYHLHTGPNDLAARCLLVGSPERAHLIATTMFENARLVADHRGLKSYTGEFNGFPVSVVTVGMGGPAMGMILPEAVRSGAKILIRVGSCSALIVEANIGDSAICSGAVRLDGASQNWAMPEFPAIADLDVTLALRSAAQRLGLPFHLGIGATTACFYEGQARPDEAGYIPPWALAQHDALIRAGAIIYEMENSALFVRAATLPERPRVGSVCAIFGNRRTDAFGIQGEEEAATIALHALCQLGE